METESTNTDVHGEETHEIERYSRQKRSHKKSRNGCLTCRQRRVKCDERQPTCRVCARRGIECVYAGSRTQTPSQELLAVVQDPWPVGDDSHVSSALPAYRQVSDGLLFQYYLEHVSYTFASIHTNAALARIWQSGIPAVAFSSPGASHAVRAVSALCMGRKQRDAINPSQDYQATAKLHYGKAMQLLRMSIDGSNGVSADEVMACCMALVPCALALSQDLKNGDLFGDWIVHLRACQTLGDILKGSAKELTRRDQLVGWPQPSNPGLDRPVTDAMSHKLLLVDSPIMLQSIRESKKDIAEGLRAAVGVHLNLPPADDAALVAAIDRLEYTYHYITECRVYNYYRAVLHWIVQASPRFIELLMAENELALVIFAAWLVGTMVCDDLWWFRGFGASRIPIVAMKLRQMNSPYCHLVRWPVAMARQWEACSKDVRMSTS